MKASNILRLYEKAIFVSEFETKLCDFAIITANNPNGSGKYPLLNHLWDCSLVTRLREQRLAFLPLFGCAPDLSHFEHSCAINCSLTEAQHLSKLFNQLAFYWCSSRCYLYLSEGPLEAAAEMGAVAEHWLCLPECYQGLYKEYCHV